MVVGFSVTCVLARGRRAYGGRHDLVAADMWPEASPTQSLEIHGRSVIVKRDDLLVASKGVSGNKVRKLYAMLRDGRQEPVVSFGGAQSNNMAALAVMCSRQGRRFIYYTRSLPSFLRDKPIGNFRVALESGATFREVSAETLRNFGPEMVDDQHRFHFVPMGGACAQAEEGVRILANELTQHHQCGAAQTTYQIAVACGTGTLALFLERHLRMLKAPISVLAVPVVGDADYLLAQMRELDASTGGYGRLPRVLKPVAKQPFGKERPELLAHWSELSDQGLGVDLLYGARAWEILLDARDEWLEHPDALPMYYHCGGLEGNESQLARYRRKGLTT